MARELDLTTSANRFALASIGCALAALVVATLILIIVSLGLATTGLQRARIQSTSATLAYADSGVPIRL